MLRLYGFSDPRFSYRSEAVPASMHPTAAAAILYAHRDLMDPEHSVLDPFCGAGTLLIERARIMGARSLTGLDISPAAWRIARTNLDNACLHAKVFNRDCRGYTVKDKVHEIICNLPFGHRVGSHGTTTNSTTMYCHSGRICSTKMALFWPSPTTSNCFPRWPNDTAIESCAEPALPMADCRQRVFCYSDKNRQTAVFGFIRLTHHADVTFRYYELREIL